MRNVDNLPPSCAVVTKSGNPNFLKPSGALQACNRTDLPLPLPFLTQDCAGDKIEKNEMGGACSAYGGEERRTRGFVGET